MKTTKENNRKQGRPYIGKQYTFVRVPLPVHAKLREMAESEQRALQVVTERIIKAGLTAEQIILN